MRPASIILKATHRRGRKWRKAILRRLKFDNETIRQVAALIRWHDCRMAPEKPVIRRILNKLGPELFEKLMIVQEADTMAKSLYQREKPWNGSKR